jgi:hypothetical protein
LLTAKWWQDCRDKIARGVFEDHRPYAQNRRLQEGLRRAAS